MAGETRASNFPDQGEPDAWCIYPMYDWYLDALGIFHPQQIAFARLNLSHTVMSKRKLLQLVEGGHVGGWDDPRMPTIAGLRRRGYTPAAPRDFCDRIGVTESDNLSSVSSVGVGYVSAGASSRRRAEGARVPAAARTRRQSLRAAAADCVGGCA